MGQPVASFGGGDGPRCWATIWNHVYALIMLLREFQDAAVFGPLYSDQHHWDLSWVLCHFLSPVCTCIEPQTAEGWRQQPELLASCLAVLLIFFMMASAGG